MIIGYARVSKSDQSLSLQIQALEAVGCKTIFTDHGVSGGLSSRPGLDQAMQRLRPGGKLVVWRLDRLGRSLVNLVHLLEQLGCKNIGFQSITEHIDTNSSGGRLVFHFMAALAEFERALISDRTRAGLAAVKASGRSLGRRPTLDPMQCHEALQLKLERAWSTTELAVHLGVNPRTLGRLLSKHRESEEARL